MLEHRAKKLSVTGIDDVPQRNQDTPILPCTFLMGVALFQCPDEDGEDSRHFGRVGTPSLDDVGMH